MLVGKSHNPDANQPAKSRGKQNTKRSNWDFCQNQKKERETDSFLLLSTTNIKICKFTENVHVVYLIFAYISQFPSTFFLHLIFRDSTIFPVADSIYRNSHERTELVLN